MIIKTAYALPFRVTYPTKPFFSSGGAASLVVQLSKDSGADHISETIRRFVDLANTGALAGSTIEPWRSGLAATTSMTVGPRRVSQIIDTCAIDDTSLVVLCDLLQHEGAAGYVEELEITREGSTRQILRSEQDSFSTMPERFQKIPFPIEDEQPECGTYSFELSLSRPLIDLERTTLRAALNIWTTAVLAGAFALAPIPPADNYAEIDGPPIEYDSTLEWSVFKLRAAPAAIDCLINIFAAFHSRCCPIKELIIS